jgi:hypothetical protein
MAACSTVATIKFTVRRRPAVLVAPASPTPRELKRLSDFDDQDSLRLQIPVIHFYERMESMAMGGKDDKDTAVVIRDAVARALVPYYPFAGRLREHDGGKLAVDCTAEGVLFVEADADVRLEQFGDSLLPPFPCVEELIFDVPGSSAILDTPLLLIQVQLAFLSSNSLLLCHAMPCHASHMNNAKFYYVRAGDPTRLWRVRPGGPAEPHHGGRAGAHAVPGRRGRAGTG